jgi:hypothetical protein
VGDLSDSDVLVMTDVDDTTEAATGSTKKVLISELATYFNSDLAVDDLITLSGRDKGSTTIEDPNSDIEATTIDGALTEFAAAIELNTAKDTYPGTATDSTEGGVELATDAEAVTGTSDSVVVTPGNLTARLAAPGAIGGTTPATSIKADEIDLTATADPVWGFKDSDSGDTDKTIARLKANAETTTEGSVDADFWIDVLQGGSWTEVLRFDESDDQWESTKVMDFAILDPASDITATMIQAALAEFAAAIELNTAKVTFNWDYDYNDLINTPTIPTASSLNLDDLITLSGRPEGSTAIEDPNGDVTATTIDGAITEIAAAVELNTAKVTMTYPGAGVPNSTGSAWGTSYGVQTSVRVEGSSTDTDLVTEDAVRDALDALPGGHDAVSLGTTLGNNLLGLSTQQITLDTQTANYGFFGPVSGGAAAPSFRAMVAADIPADIITFDKIDDDGNFGPFIGAWDFTGGSIEIPNGTDPNVDAAGEIAFDTDDNVLRGFDGTNQFALGRKIEAIHVTAISPNDWDDTTRDAFLFWSNESGMSFIITGWKGWSDTDDTTLNIETTAADGSSSATVDAVEIATGSGPYTGADTTITAATIANGSLLWLDFDDTDDPGYVKMTIYGYYNADVD